MITVVDYIGHTDNEGIPIGHPVKVINETVALVAPITDVCVAASSCHAKEIFMQPLLSFIELPYHIKVFSQTKLRNLLYKYINLCTLFRKSKDINWFINVDFSLFLFLYFFRWCNFRIWITMYYNPLKGASKWRQKIVRKVLSKADLVVATNKHLKEELPGNVIFIPDYYYNTALYETNRMTDKQHKMVCLGTMGDTKQLEDLIEAAKALPFPVEIVGNFSQNVERFDKLKFQAKGYSHIHIENKYVENDLFYRMISESRYVVLPYDMALYDERTSGILLESIFLGSIPVAPRALLDYNAIQGVGYNTLKELPEAINASDCNQIIMKNQKLVETLFSMERIQEIIKAQIDK